MKNLKMGQSSFESLSQQARQVIFDLVYPVGSYIYIDNPDFNTVAKVEAYYGGHWEQVADGTFIEAGSTPGTHEPGLPNITGYFGSGGQHLMISASGAFRRVDGALKWAGDDTTHWESDRYNVDFDASRSNSIYGNSSTVQPKSKVVYIYHRLPVQNS